MNGIPQSTESGHCRHHFVHIHLHSALPKKEDLFEDQKSFKRQIDAKCWLVTLAKAALGLTS
jgi:hypothetical protein